MSRQFLAAFVVVAVSCSGALLSQQSQWQQLAPPSGPSGPVGPPNIGAIAYDDLRDRIVLSSWSHSGQPWASQLWSFDGQQWRRLAQPTVLDSRTYIGMAYDSRRGRMVFQGGIEDPSFQVHLPRETWLLEDGSWQRLAGGPPMRFGHVLVYDEERDRVVLAGGQGLVGFYWGTTNETWEFDGQSWLQRADLPQPRAFAGGAYDPRRGRTVVYGGHYISGGGSYPHFDALEWDGSAWQPLPTTGATPALSEVAMHYDRERDRCVLYGLGANRTTRELWEYDGTSWAKDPVAPPAAGFAVRASVYDRQRGRLVGISPNGLTSGPSVWSRSLPGMAVAQPYGVGCGVPAMRAVVDPAARPLLGSTLGVDIEGVPSGAAFMCFGWSNRRALGLSLPTMMDGFGLPGCWLLQSDDAITLPSTMTGATSARFAIVMPAGAGFAGLRFFLQPWGPAPGYNAGGGIVGDAVAVTLGTF